MHIVGLLLKFEIVSRINSYYLIKDTYKHKDLPEKLSIFPEAHLEIKIDANIDQQSTEKYSE